MDIRNIYFASLVLLLILITWSCQTGQEQATPPQELYAHFQPIAPADTLAVRLDTVAEDSGRVIPAPLFLAAVDTTLIDELMYEPDTSDFQARAYWQLPLDENFDACLFGIEQGWFRFKYLLIYSKSAENFVNIVPAAYLYGGESSYIISESWIFDVKTHLTIMTRYLDRTLRNIATEPEEVKLKSAGLRQWSQGEFQEVPVRDSVRWIRRYPLEWDD